MGGERTGFLYARYLGAMAIVMERCAEYCGLLEVGGILGLLDSASVECTRSGFEDLGFLLDSVG